MFAKVLVANRGEIAVRAFRAAYELGARTVAVFPHEDRGSEHRLKADEAYEIGERGHPVRAYLDPQAVVDAAVHAGAEAVYPGYGFLSENPALAEACAAAGITFVGPSADILRLTGNKASAVAAAQSAGVPVLRNVAPSRDADEVCRNAAELNFPVFVKAVAGGGGRGMRRVDDPDDLREAVESAMREADGAFGDPTVFVEEAVTDPRHIEVQILADTQGNVIHLFERDCSLQRRHQKVVEIAPAPHLDPALRDRICADAVAFAREIGYVNAGTVEFLVDPEGRHVFIEMNPRIQVEHTVTEEVTDVDLVQSQLRIAAGETLADLGLSQDDIRVRGAALQCRITTEDPANGFRPDTGRITAYRSPGGAGIRLDGGTTYTGAEVSAHFDSMLTKLTCRGRTFELAVDRARRAVAEFRIRGVATNIPFLQAVLDDPDFRAGQGDHLVHRAAPAAAHRPLVGRPRHPTAALPRRRHGQQAARRCADDRRPGEQAAVTSRRRSAGRLAPATARRRSRGVRRRAAAAACGRRHRHDDARCPPVLARDPRAHPRPRRRRPHIAALTPQLLSLECWGGATYDVALRFLSEDPWERLAQLREAVPNICLQMLLRGRNTVGYTPYPTEVTDAFVAEAAETGIDIFRIFDALNDVEQMRAAIDAVRATPSAVAEVALCYTGDLSSPGETLYTLDYYLGLAERIVDAGAHVLAIKDMAGLLRAPAARTLVAALRERFDLPVHLHTHDTPGGQLATLLAAIDAGVDAVDAASRCARRHDQPARAVGPGRRHRPDRPRDRPVARGGLRPRAVLGGDPAAVRAVRVGTARADRPGLPPRDPRRPALQPAPAGDRTRSRREVRADRGHVRRRQRHPRQHRQGHAVQQGGRRPRTRARRGRRRPAGVRRRPRVVRRPRLGDRLPVRRARRSTRRLAGAVPHQGAQGPVVPSRGRRSSTPTTRQPSTTTSFARSTGCSSPGRPRTSPTRASATATSRCCRPATSSTASTSTTSTTSTSAKGVRLILGVESISQPDERGFRTVMCTINGQLRPVSVRDRSVSSDAPAQERADTSVPGQVGAPFDGVVSSWSSVGDQVEAGQSVATIEAMKMEASITTPVAGTVERVALDGPRTVEGGDLVVVVKA